MKFAQVILCSQMALKPLRIENGPEHHLRAESFSTRPFGDSLELKFELVRRFRLPLRGELFRK
jgi:hypothetical protein